MMKIVVGMPMIVALADASVTGERGVGGDIDGAGDVCCVSSCGDCVVDGVFDGIVGAVRDRVIDGAIDGIVDGVRDGLRDWTGVLDGVDGG